MRFSIQRPIATLMLYCMLLLLGFVSLSKLEVNLFPDIVFPRITVLTPYPDVSPDEIEHLVTVPIEDSVSSVNGVKKITSTSQEGLSIVTIQFEWGSDLDLAVINLRQKLDLTKSVLPQDAGKSLIVKFDPSSEPIILLVSKPERISSEELRDFIEKNIRPSFERIDGVASVTILGGRRREIRVNLDAEKLQSQGLTVEQIGKSLSATNYNYPTGNVKGGDKEFTVRFEGDFTKLADIGETVVATGNAGDPVYLNKISEIIDGYRERTGSTLHNGTEAVTVGLKKEPGKNTIRTAENIRSALENINQEFGEIVTFEIIHDSSLYISDSISSVKNSAILGGFIAFLILFIFLQDIKSAVIIAASIPVSIITTFLFMYISDVTLNIMSLGGLSLGTGMLVDNAIVSLEAIGYERQKYADRTTIENVINGTAQVAQSILASTVTTIAIFLPIIFVSGIAGEIFRDLAFTVTFSLISSLFSSLTLIPVLSILPFENFPILRHLLKMNTYGKPIFLFIENSYGRLQKRYIEVLGRTITSPGKTLKFAASLSVVGIFLFLLLDRELFPEVDTGVVTSEFVLPEGTVLEDSEEYIKKIHGFTETNRMTLHAVSDAGHDEHDIGSMINGMKKNNYIKSLFFVNTDRLDSAQFAEQMRKGVSLNAGITANIKIKGDPLQELIGESKNLYILKVESESRGSGRVITESILSELRPLENVQILESSVTSLDPEIRVVIDGEKASSNFVYPAQIGNTLRSAVQGVVPTVYREDDKEIDIRVRLREEDRNHPDKLLRLNVSKPDGGYISLKELADLKEETGLSNILRENQKRIDNIILNYDGDMEAIENVIEKVREKNKNVDKTLQITLEKSNKETMDSLQSLVFAFILAVVIIYQILAAQFESLIHPLTLASSIPLMIFGSSFSLFITGQSLNISSTIGLVLLVGIVVNTSIILYEFFQQNYTAYGVGEAKTEEEFRLLLKQSILKSAEIRLRPIMLTTSTTVLGMVPMAAVIFTGGSMQASMAIVVIGGLLTSTVMTLIVFPVLYYLTTLFLNRKLFS
jgi:multidrug efflux pump subunit AcrB